MMLGALDARRQIPPITDSDPAFGLGEAYAVSQAVTTMRTARGSRVAGWKIGFTNRTIWDEYAVHAPIWGPVYDTTLVRLDEADAAPVVDVTSFVDPRIEPEIVFRMARTPAPNLDEQALLACIDGVAHGFEVVQSLFPRWRFAAADTVAAFGLHGALVVGPVAAVTDANRERWFDQLQRFEIALFRDGSAIDRGSAANVLGGPLSALRHFVRGLAEQPLGRGILPGDVITTGTVTRAFPVMEGETWSTALAGLSLPAMTLRFGDRLEALVEHCVVRAATARFHFDNPAASRDADHYAEAVAASVDAEAELATLLFREPDRLERARNEIARRALHLADRRNTRANP